MQFDRLRLLREVDRHAEVAGLEVAGAQDAGAVGPQFAGRLERGPLAAILHLFDGLREDRHHAGRSVGLHADRQYQQVVPIHRGDADGRVRDDRPRLVAGLGDGDAECLPAGLVDQRRLGRAVDLQGGPVRRRHNDRSFGGEEGGGDEECGHGVECKATPANAYAAGAAASEPCVYSCPFCTGALGDAEPRSGFSPFGSIRSVLKVERPSKLSPEDQLPVGCGTSESLPSVKKV